MADQPNAEHPAALRTIAAAVLDFVPVNNVVIAADHPLLPDTVTVIGTLPDEFGPDCLALHCDLSECPDAGQRDYITLARVQAANDIVQRYAGDQRCPLLIFTLPDNSGVQFIYGEPEPDNIRRLQSVHRLTYRWGEPNRTTLDALEQIGQAIAGGAPPQIALQDGFNVQPVTEAFFRDYKAA